MKRNPGPTVPCGRCRLFVEEHQGNSEREPVGELGGIEERFRDIVRVRASARIRGGLAGDRGPRRNSLRGKCIRSSSRPCGVPSSVARLMPWRLDNPIRAR